MSKLFPYTVHGVTFRSVGEPIAEQPSPEAIAARAKKRSKPAGSGRTAKGVAGRTQAFPVCVSPAVDAYLASMGKSRGEQVENGIRELARLQWVHEGIRPPKGMECAEYLRDMEITETHCHECGFEFPVEAEHLYGPYHKTDCQFYETEGR